MKIFTILGKQKKSGLYPIYVQIYLGGERVLLNTKIETEKALFDDRRGQIRGSTKEVKDHNMIIEQVRGRVNEILVKYRLKNKEITAEQFKAEFSHPSYDIDFLFWMEAEIRTKRNEVGPRRIIKYTTIFNKLKEFRPVINFSDIDYFFVEDFRGWLKNRKKNTLNTISSNLAVLKVFTTRAKRKGLIESDPFLDIRIGRGKPDRTFCTEEELSQLWTLYTGDGAKLKKHHRPVLRHFLFMCFTGLRISDFSAMTFDNIANGSLRLYPLKTRSKKKEMIKVPLCQKAMKLILDEGNTHGHLFNPVTEQRMNFNIKEIAAIAGIRKPLSNHAARHTFATLFIRKTSDVATLQKLLGHSRIEETMVYVHITEETLFDQMKKFEEALQF